MIAHDIGVSIGGQRLLEGMSFTLAPGHLTVVIGGNGAGKSTLLRALAGLAAPDRGTVRLGGRDVTSLPPRRRALLVAHLPQAATVTWAVTGRDLVALGRLPHGLELSARSWSAENGAAIDNAMVRTGTAALASRRVDRLSQGERARLLLARVLATDAGVLLLDEPVASLDPAQALAMMRVLAVEAARGKAIAVVMHDLVLAQRFADRALLLTRGRIVAQGEPSDVFTEAHVTAAYDITVQRVEIGGRPVLVPLEAQASRPGVPA